MAQYPKIEDVLNLARVYINDTLPGLAGLVGEGRVFIDSWPPILIILNEALDAFQRDTETSGVPALQKVVIISNIPPVNGVNGVGQPDPAAFQWMGFENFWDGARQLSTPTLPADLTVPLEIAQRNSAEMLTFSKVEQAANGLESRYQDFSLGQWDWKSGQVQWNGALVAKDIQLTYQAAIPLYPATTSASQFPSTRITLDGCLLPLALRCAYTFCAARDKTGAADNLIARYNHEVARLVQRETRRAQRVLYERAPFGETGDTWGWMH